MEYEKIKPYIEKRLISERVHPEDPRIRIFNYTDKCQFERVWDEVTINCRGLIMNVETGEILARGFPKFFNYGEHIAAGLPIPDETPVVTEKMDGSLGILYQLNGKMWIATRGAFESDQAKWATEYWRKTFDSKMFGPEMHSNEASILFEIIYPQNRIVVEYDFSGLVFLAALDTKTGLQIGHSDIPRYKEVYAYHPIKTVKEVDITDVKKLAAMDEMEGEGFVVFYPKANVRMKIKFPEYVRLHRLVTGVSEIAIWEYMRDGRSFDDLLKKVPDEFYNWVKEVQKRICSQFSALYNQAKETFLIVENYNTRKEQADFIMKNAKDVAMSTFCLLDEKKERAELLIWRKVRPHGEKPFKIEL